jgi:heme A synthase
MTNHRNWALFTASIFILLAIWAYVTQRGARSVNPLFVAVMLLATGLLFITGYKGGEVVYRYGLGVLSTPDMRQHNLIVHSKESTPEKENLEQRSQSHDESGGHPHDHGDHAH